MRVIGLKENIKLGITDKDFELARKIEDTIQWDPSKEDNSLEGTPKEDQRFSYIKYDK